MSTALNSRIIEKHITLDENKKGFVMDILPQSSKILTQLDRQKKQSEKTFQDLLAKVKKVEKFQKKNIVTRDLKKNRAKEGDVIFLGQISLEFNQ